MAIFPIPPKCNGGSYIAFSCHASLITSNLEQFLSLFFCLSQHWRFWSTQASCLLPGPSRPCSLSHVLEPPGIVWVYAAQVTEIINPSVRTQKVTSPSRMEEKLVNREWYPHLRPLAANPSRGQESLWNMFWFHVWKYVLSLAQLPSAFYIRRHCFFPPSFLSLLSASSPLQFLISAKMPETFPRPRVERARVFFLQGGAQWQPFVPGWLKSACVL